MSYEEKVDGLKKAAEEIDFGKAVPVRYQPTRRLPFRYDFVDYKVSLSQSLSGGADLLVIPSASKVAVNDTLPDNKKRALVAQGILEIMIRNTKEVSPAEARAEALKLLGFKKG